MRRLQMEVRWRKSDLREKKNFEFESNNMQKQPSRGVLNKTYSENMQQIYRRTPMQKCDFNEVALQLHWTHTSVWVFSFKFAAYFQNTFYSYGGLLLNLDFKLWSFNMKSTLLRILTHFMSLVCFLPPKSIRKLVVFLCFQKVLKETGAMMWVKRC